jgi:hypothetical protein
MGLLIAFGTIDLGQFWPSGESDGDTAHVLVDRFEFDGKRTNAFEGATLARKPVLHNGAITVRWHHPSCTTGHRPGTASIGARHPHCTWLPSSRTRAGVQRRFGKGSAVDALEPTLTERFAERVPHVRVILDHDDRPRPCSVGRAGPPSLLLCVNRDTGAYKHVPGGGLLTGKK